MNKFWEWMEKKYKASSAIKGYMYINSMPVEQTKQILLGYMIEYLLEKDIICDWSEISNNLIDCFDDAYSDVEKLINEIIRDNKKKVQINYFDNNIMFK